MHLKSINFVEMTLFIATLICIQRKYSKQMGRKAFIGSELIFSDTVHQFLQELTLSLMPDSTLAVATSCHWVKKIISYSNFHQTFQIGSYFFRNTYGLVKKIFRAKKRTSIGLIFSHFRSIFLIFGLFFSPTENFVIFICFTINFLNCFVYCPSGHFKINV